MIRKPLKAVLLFSALTFNHLVSASNLSIGEDIALHDNLPTLRAKLENYCETQKLIDVEKVTYPLAKDNEQHLICTNYNKDEVHFEKVAFVLADDKLTQMEAKGIPLQLLQSRLGEKMATYLGMDVYEKGRFWIDSKESRFLWIHKDAGHPNLFAWKNTYLNSKQSAAVNFSTKIPSLLDFNSNIEKLRPEFKHDCKQIKEDKIKKIWLPNNPKEQIQINCFGYSFAGFDRKFEAVFGDGKLQVLWVLTAKAEEDRVRKLLVADWGNPEINTDDWEVYGGGRISLRKDKPEFLILSDEMIPLYREKLKAKK